MFKRTAAALLAANLLFTPFSNKIEANTPTPAEPNPIGWNKIYDTWIYKIDNWNYATGWRLISGDWYWFNEYGAMQTGWIYDNGNWYYLKNCGKMAQGEWVKSNGKWYFMMPYTGKIAYNAWVYWYGDVYHTDNNGIMISGDWLKFNEKWYFFFTDGRMARNCTLSIDDHVYGINKEGILVGMV